MIYFFWVCQIKMRQLPNVKVTAVKCQSNSWQMQKLQLKCTSDSCQIPNDSCQMQKWQLSNAKVTPVSSNNRYSELWTILLLIITSTTVSQIWNKNNFPRWRHLGSLLNYYLILQYVFFLNRHFVMCGIPFYLYLVPNII